jgi:bacillithiol biosynthesis cysteine-adding enzyme BshC
MNGIRVIDTPLEFGRLAEAALAHETPVEWFTRAPAGRAAWGSQCRAVASEHGQWLDALRPALGNGAALLDRVCDGRGVVVTTGQQAGLFAGPMYTWFKALSALETARALERETNVPVAPVFWAATDDADFLEAASTVIATAGGVDRLTLHDAPPDGVPMSHARLTAEITPLFHQVRAAAGPHADERLLHAAQAFRAGATVGDAYVSMLRSLLEPLGIAVLDSSHAAVGAASRPVLDAALANAAAVHATLSARQAEFDAAHFDAPVKVDRELSLVFVWEPGPDGLPRKRRLTVAESARAVGTDARMSPNVLLRPVVERALLPTVGYMAGPSETAYFTQCTAVAAVLEVAAPLALPRWSGMVVPDDVAAALASLSLAPGDLRDPHAAETTLARSALPAGAAGALRDLREAITRDIAQLDGLLPAAALDGARGQLEHRADRIERRVLAAVKRRNAGTMHAIAAARAVLYPFGKPQERALNVIPLWAQSGDAFVSDVRAACAAHAHELITGHRPPK